MKAHYKMISWTEMVNLIGMMGKSIKEAFLMGNYMVMDQSSIRVDRL